MVEFYQNLFKGVDSVELVDTTPKPDGSLEVQMKLQHATDGNPPGTDGFHRGCGGPEEQWRRVASWRMVRGDASGCLGEAAGCTTTPGECSAGQCAMNSGAGKTKAAESPTGLNLQAATN